MTEEQIPKLMAMFVEHQKFFELLPTDRAQWAIQRPCEAIKVICRALGDVTTPPQSTPLADTDIRLRLKIWKRIQIGGVEASELFKRVDMVTPMGPHTQAIVRRPEFIVSNTQRMVDLVILTPAQMGFTSPPTNEELLSDEKCIARSINKLDRQAIRLCDPEITLHLFLQLHKHEKESLELWMAMKPIPPMNKGGLEVVMGIEPQCGVHFRKLRPDHRWSLSTKLVFILDELPPPPPKAVPSPSAPAP